MTLAERGAYERKHSQRSGVVADILAALPLDHGITPKRLHIAIGKWSRITVQRVLSELVKDGRATFVGEDGHRLYRRTPR